MSVDEAVTELIDEKITDLKVEIGEDVAKLVAEGIEGLDWSDQADAILGSVDVESYLDIPRILRDNDIVTDSDVDDKVAEGIDNIDWDYAIRANSLVTEDVLDEKITEVVDNIDWDSAISDNELVQQGDLDDAISAAITDAVDGQFDWDELASKHELVSRSGVRGIVFELIKTAIADERATQQQKATPVTNVEVAALQTVEIRITALEAKVDTLVGLLTKAHTALQMQAEVAEAVAKLAAGRSQS